MKSFLIVLNLISFYPVAYANKMIKEGANSISSTVALHNFIISESLIKNNKVAIIACDSLEQPLEYIHGTFLFSVNGFQQSLTLIDGVATLPQPIDQSTFIYLRHKNAHGTTGKLYYLIKTASGIKPIKISWWILVATPFIFLCIGAIFRRFMIIAAGLIVFLFLFNSTNGLSLSTLLNTFLDGLKHFF